MEKTPEEIAASLIEDEDKKYDWVDCGLNHGEPYADLKKDVIIADIAAVIREVIKACAMIADAEIQPNLEKYGRSDAMAPSMVAARIRNAILERL